MATLSSSALRQQLEAVWNSSGVKQGHNRTIWKLNGVSLDDSPGEELKIKDSPEVIAFRRKCTRHYGPPPPPPYNPKGPLQMSKEHRERIKGTRNYRWLVAGYGLTIAAFERRSKDESPLPGLISVTIDPDPIATKQALGARIEEARAMTTQEAELVAEKADETIRAVVETIGRAPGVQNDREEGALSFLRARRRVASSPVAKIVSPVRPPSEAPKTRQRAPAAILDAAAKGKRPPIPRLAPASAARLKGLTSQLVRMVRNDDLTGLRATSFPVSSGSRMKLERYRLSAIIAIETRLAKLKELSR
jgi:hypothetical protein